MIHEPEVVGGNMFGASESYDEEESEKHSLFLGDLSIYCDEKDIEAAFAPYGNIVDIRIQRSKETSRALSYGFIEFGTQESAAAALREMNYFLLKGRPLRIRWAADRKNPIKSAATPHDSAATVYVRFLTQADNVVVSEELLRELFNQYGPVFDCAIKKLSQEQKGARIKGYAFVSFDSGALAQGGVDVAGVEAALRACTDLRNRVVNQVRYRCELGNRLQKQAASMGLAPMNPIPSVGGMNGMNNMGMNTHMGNTLPCITPGGYMTPNTVYQQPLTSYPPTCVPQYQSPPEQAQGFTVYTPSFAPSPYASREGTPTNYQLRMQQLASQMAQAQAQQAQVQQAQVQQAGPPQMQQLMQQHQLPVPPPLPLQQQAAQPQYVPQLGYTPLHTPTNGNLLTSVGVMLQQQQLAQQHQAHHQAHQSHPAVSPHSSHPAQGLSYHAQLAAQAQAQLQAQALAQASLHPPQYVQYQYYPSGLNSGCNSGAATPVSVARAALTASQVQGVGVPGVPGQMVMSMPGMMMVPMAMQNLSMPNMHGYPQHQHHTPAYTPTAYAHHQAQHAAQQAQAQAQQQAAHQQQQGQQGHAHPAQGPSALQHHAQQQQGILKELSCSQHFAAKGIKLSIKTHSFDEPSPAPQPAQRSYSTECTPRELYLQRKQQQGQNPASRRAQYANSNSNNTNVNNTSTNTISYNNASSNNTSQAFSPNASTPVTVHEHKPASRRGSNDSITTTSLYLGNMSIDESSEFQESRGDRCDKIDRCDRGDRGDTDVETPVSV